MPNKKLTGAQRLRQMLQDPSYTVLAPGVYDGLTARIALAAGYECLYMTGAGTSVSRLGWADLGIATFNDMCANAEMIANLDTSVPVIADADTGYGGPFMVARTVTAYARAGVAALHLEDQVQEKRCGQLLGKQLVSREVYYSRLRAAVNARDEAGSDMMIIARTDARAGESFDEAIARLQGAAEIGVDGLFLEALKSQEEARHACEILNKSTGLPMLLNMVPGAVTPDTTVDEAKEIGFRIVIFPSVCLEAVLESCTRAVQGLKKNGMMDVGAGAGGVRTLFDICGLKDAMELDKKAGGKAFDSI